MSSNKDLFERRLEREYAEALNAMRFTDAQKSRMAENIAAEARRSLAGAQAGEASASRRVAASERAGASRKAVAAGRHGASGKKVVAESAGRRSFVRSPAAVAAVLAICLVLPLTAMAASGKLDGVLKDVTDWRGAIVGQTYEQATDEIAVSVVVGDGELVVTAAFDDPKAPPYSEAERLGISAYRVLDADGKVVAEGSAESAEVANGQAAIGVPLDSMGPGDYTLVISSFVSEHKADQDLVISGSWKCGFSW